MIIIKPETSVKTVWRIYLVLISLLPAFAISFFLSGKSVFMPVALVWFAVFIFFFAVYIPVYHKNLVYALNDNTLTLKHGVFYTSIYNMPVNNIQFTSIVISPLMRPFGLVSLKVVAPGAKIILPGLTLKESRKLEKSLDKIKRGAGA